MSFLGITSPFSRLLSSSPDASPSKASPTKYSIRPSVDSAVDLTTPPSLTPEPRRPSSSSSAMTSTASRPFFGDGAEGNVSRSISFTTEYRDSSFDGEPDIPESIRKESPDEDGFVASEDYFAKPELLYGGSMQEIETTIDDYKKKIQSIVVLSSATSEENSPKVSEAQIAAAKALWAEKKQDLVSKLVQLRIKQQDLKENPSLDELDFRKILGHKFKRRDPATSSSVSLNCFVDGQLEDNETKYISKVYCEQCLGIIWRLVQTWHRCVCCGFACHTSCLNHVVRTCVATRLRPQPGGTSFAQLQTAASMDICPEKGLSAQNYKCHECKASLGFGSHASEEPRLCDYSGYFFCYKCHWNDSVATPARILHNWDFEPRLVSRSSRQLIRLIQDRPFVRIADINPMLFSFVSELDRIKTLREKILIMKLYLTTCKNSLEEKLLLRLRHRQHFVENSDMFSLQDLADVHEGVLEPELQKIHDYYAKHICVDCQLCSAKGFVCEQCQSEQVIFPFGNDVVVCPRCSNVFHRLCYRRCEGACRRCDRIEERRKRRSSDEADDDDDDED